MGTPAARLPQSMSGAMKFMFSLQNPGSQAHAWEPTAREALPRVVTRPDKTRGRASRAMRSQAEPGTEVSDYPHAQAPRQVGDQCLGQRAGGVHEHIVATVALAAFLHFLQELLQGAHIG